MITIAIIAILASVAIPKFADLIRKAQEGSTKGSLGTLRSTLSIYYSAMEGQFPATLYDLTDSGTYLSYLPTVYAPPYHSSNTNAGTCTQCVGPLCTCMLLTPGCLNLDGAVGVSWYYCGVPTDPTDGTVLVLCTHTDSKGTTWSTY
jgi:type II secretory pathway pseudopilin PulG